MSGRTEVLRAATDDDIEAIRAWRNHPQVRQASLTTHEISAAEHARWWSAVSADPTRRVLIYERLGVPSGVVSFAPAPDAGPEVAEWSFYLDVDGLQERREMLPAWLEAERDAVHYAFDELKLERLVGQVLADNSAMLQLHRRFGFIETGRYTAEIDGSPKEIIWTELRAADRRG